MTTTTLGQRLAGALPPAGAARTLTMNAFVGSIGTGLFLTGSVLYYTRALNLSVTSVGIGLSIAGAVGMIASIAVGAVADRFGPRPTMVGLHAFRVVAYLALAFVSNYWQFLVMVVLVTCADRAGPPTNQAMIGRIFDKAQRVRTNAYMRAVRNIGLAVGALLAGTAVEMGTDTAYRVLVIGNAVSFLPMALLVASLARYERPPAPVTAEATPRGGWRDAVRDVPFLSLSMTNGVVLLHDSILFVALPLWIVGHTPAPPFMVSTVLIVNTVLTALGQVWWTRLTSSLPAAARAFTSAGLLLAVSSCVFAAAHYGNAWTASVLVVAAVVLLTAGENLHSASAWEVSYELSPAQSQASYLAVFNLGSNGQDMVGPSVVTALGVTAGVVGWFGIAALFLVSSASARACIRWTVRSRERRHVGADGTAVAAGAVQ
jgi:Na+/melibiose symporter-like transporter